MEGTRWLVLGRRNSSNVWEISQFICMSIINLISGYIYLIYLSVYNVQIVQVGDIRVIERR